jgi:hypothetical protein
MKRLFNIILLAFPVKLFLWCLYSPLNIINPFYDALLTCSLFLLWAMSMLQYDDIRVKKVYKRMNLISFIMVVVLIFTSPLLAEVGEKLAIVRNKALATSERSPRNNSIKMLFHKNQDRR